MVENKSRFGVGGMVCQKMFSVYEGTIEEILTPDQVKYLMDLGRRGVVFDMLGVVDDGN